MQVTVYVIVALLSILRHATSALVHATPAVDIGDGPAANTSAVASFNSGVPAQGSGGGAGLGHLFPAIQHGQQFIVPLCNSNSTCGGGSGSAGDKNGKRAVDAEGKYVPPRAEIDAAFEPTVSTLTDTRKFSTA